METWIRDGQLKAIDVSTSPGRHTWRIRQADLDEFLEARSSLRSRCLWSREEAVA